MKKRCLKTISIFLCIISTIIFTTSCRQSTENGVEIGRYILNGTDESSYIRVSRDYLELINVDTSEIIEGIIFAFTSFPLTNNETGEELLITPTEATDEELDIMRDLFSYFFEGELRYMHEIHGEVEEIILTEGFSFVLEYFSDTRTIIFFNKEFILID